jgi:CheY-like chemotaxis protein
MSERSLSLLVVEDEPMIRMLLCDMLEDLGHKVAGQAGRIGEAVDLVQTGVPFDAAILDLNLAGEVALPVAEAVDARAIPFIFATGYGSVGVPERFRERPVLQKPYVLESLQRALNAIR